MDKRTKIISMSVFVLLITASVFLAYNSDEKKNPADLSGVENNLTDLTGENYEENTTVLSKEEYENSITALSNEDYENFDIKVAVKDNKFLSEVIRVLGIKKVMQILVEQSGAGSIYDCHQEAHKIGRIGYDVEKEKAFGSCNASCHSGCYHGAMESFLTAKGVSNLARDIKEVCSQFNTSFGNFECLHGVGHGVLAYVDYDMPSAIKECQKLAGGWSQSSCYGGVFMENILTGQGLGASEKVDHKTEWVNQTDMHFPCNAIDKDYSVQYECYQMQTSWMLTLSGYDFDKVSKECLNAPENMKPVCFKSFGRDSAGHSLRDPVKILNYCSKVPNAENYYDKCIEGALNVIVDFWGPDLNDQATQLCRLTEGSHKQRCYELLSWRLEDIFISKTDQYKVCNTFESGYQDLCK